MGDSRNVNTLGAGIDPILAMRCRHDRHSRRHRAVFDATTSTVSWVVGAIMGALWRRDKHPRSTIRPGGPVGTDLYRIRPPRSSARQEVSWREAILRCRRASRSRKLLRPSDSPAILDLRRIMFQQYPQRDVNEPVLLHEGRFRVRAGDRSIEASGSAHLRWLPSPGIVFDIETDEPVGLDLEVLNVDLPHFATKNVRAVSTAAPGLIRASAAEMEWSGNRRLFSVGFQIVNCPDFVTPGPAAVPGDPTAVGSGYGTIQTVGLNHDGWRIRIVAVAESGDRYKKLNATGGYVFTHVGQLTRADGSAFSAAEAKQILESLRVFLSFARGAACALPIQWGRGEDDEIVWQRFGSPIVDGWVRAYLPLEGAVMMDPPAAAERGCSRLRGLPGRRPRSRLPTGGAWGRAPPSSPRRPP